MKILLLLPLLIGFLVPTIAHNEDNGGDAMHAEGSNQECHHFAKEREC